jgi:hypothetical protein
VSLTSLSLTRMSLARVGLMLMVNNEYFITQL